MSKRYTIVNGDKQYVIEAANLGVGVPLFENQELVRTQKYTTRNRYLPKVMDAFTQYTNTLLTNRDKAKNDLNPMFFDDLERLSDELRCRPLKDDIVGLRTKYVTDSLNNVALVIQSGRRGQTERDVIANAEAVLTNELNTMIAVLQTKDFNIPYEFIEPLIKGGVETKGLPPAMQLYVLMKKFLQKDQRAINLLQWVDITELPEQEALQLKDNPAAKKFYQTRFDMTMFVDMMLKVGRLRDSVDNFQRTANNKLNQVREQTEAAKKAMEAPKAKPKNEGSEDEIKEIKRPLFALKRKQRENIIAWLRKHEAVVGRRFVCMDPEDRDVYSLINPEGVGTSTVDWLSFKFVAPVEVNAMVLKMSDSKFPKTFNVAFYNGAKMVKRLTYKDSEKFSKAWQVVEEPLDPMIITDVRFDFQATTNGKRAAFSYIDFKSPCIACKDGIFRAYHAYNHPYDIHQLVQIEDGEGGCGTKFHVPDNKFEVYTYEGSPSCQIRFEHGAVWATGYKIKKSSRNELRQWELQGSNKLSDDPSDWVLLHEVAEAQQKPENLEVLKFRIIAPEPFRYFRLVATDATWQGSRKMAFRYFDLDGTFIPESTPFRPGPNKAPPPPEAAAQKPAAKPKPKDDLPPADDEAPQQKPPPRKAAQRKKEEELPPEDDGPRSRPKRSGKNSYRRREEEEEDEEEEEEDEEE